MGGCRSRTAVDHHNPSSTNPKTKGPRNRAEANERPIELMSVHGGVGSFTAVRVEVAEQLRQRQAEIEQSIRARLDHAAPNPNGPIDHTYQAGLDSAISSVFIYAMEGIRQGPGWLGPIPREAARQARSAARAGVSLGLVLRRYVAGHTGLVEYTTAICESLDASGEIVRRLIAIHDELLHHITAAVEREYAEEREIIEGSPEQRRVEIVRQLLQGRELHEADLAELDYDIHMSWHLGIIGRLPDAEPVLDAVVARLGGQFLMIRRGQRSVWGWVGAETKPSATTLERLVATPARPCALLAFGEPARGIRGWRLTHHQAREALRLAMRRPQRVVRYVDGPLVAAALRNRTLGDSLKDLFLAPLGSRTDPQGIARRRALRAYIDAECNASSAAADLGLTRHTVKGHVDMVERLIGRPLSSCLAEVAVALRLEELDVA
jgi:diguanylate cyclase with GGDEF domain/PucR-like helix-turn-helix protein